MALSLEEMIDTDVPSMAEHMQEEKRLSALTAAHFPFFEQGWEQHRFVYVNTNIRHLAKQQH